MIVYGVRMGGAVDRCVQGQTETRFAHVWFVPLVPMGSYFVSGQQSVKVPFSLRSVIVGYLRGWGVITALGCLVGLVAYGISFYNRLTIYLNGGTSATEDEIVFGTILLAMMGAGVVLGIAMFLVTRFVDKASAQRCAELSNLTGWQLTPL
ncbi:MAG: hypothetical protein R3B13_19950 [Polyangiaceae bacterium]